MKCYDVIVCDICGSSVDIVAADTAKLGESGRKQEENGIFPIAAYYELLESWERGLL